MVKKCCVVKCRSESYKDCGITFFKFPKSEGQRQLWIDALPMGKVTKYSAVCHLHFKKEDIMAISARPKLRDGAVPTIFHTRPIPTPKKTDKVPNPLFIVVKPAYSEMNEVMPSIAVNSLQRITQIKIEDEENERSCILSDNNDINFLEAPSTSEESSINRMRFSVEDKNVQKLRREVKILRQRLKRRENRIKKFK